MLQRKITLSTNTLFSNGGSGIYLYHSDNNSIANNTASSNLEYGINLGASDNNSVVGNVITYNAYSGIYLADSSLNTVAHNDLRFNLKECVSETWYYGTPHGGNTFYDNLCEEEAGIAGFDLGVFVLCGMGSLVILLRKK